jgi:hypothetical protein
MSVEMITLIEIAAELDMSQSSVCQFVHRNGIRCVAKQVNKAFYSRAEYLAVVQKKGIVRRGLDRQLVRVFLSRPFVHALESDSGVRHG